jgi:hypothetical protein
MKKNKFIEEELHFYPENPSIWPGTISNFPLPDPKPNKTIPQ